MLGCRETKDTPKIKMFQKISNNDKDQGDHNRINIFSKQAKPLIVCLTVLVRQMEKRLFFLI